MKGQAAQAGAESPRSSSGRHSWRQEKDGARTLTMMHEVLQPAKDEGKGGPTGPIYYVERVIEEASAPADEE